MFKKHIIFLITLIVAIVSIPVLCQIFILNQNGNNLLPEKEKLRESNYVYFDRVKILCDKYNVHLIDIKSKNFQDNLK